MGRSQEEREALTFLYAYMPLADAVDYPAEYFLDQVRASFRIREEMGWNVPEREFRITFSDSRGSSSGR